MLQESFSKLLLLFKHLLWLTIQHLTIFAVNINLCYIHTQCSCIQQETQCLPLLSYNGGSQRDMADTALKYKPVFDISHYHITVCP